MPYENLTTRKNFDQQIGFVQVNDTEYQIPICTRFGKVHKDFKDEAVIMIRALNDRLCQYDPALKKKFYALTEKTEGKVTILVPRLTKTNEYNEERFVLRYQNCSG